MSFFVEFTITLWHSVLMIRGAGGPAMWTAEKDTARQKEALTAGCPSACCFAQTKQMMNNCALPQFQSVFKEGVQTMNAIKSLLGWTLQLVVRRKKDNRCQALTTDAEVTSCHGRCSYEIRNEVWPNSFFTTVITPAKPVDMMSEAYLSQCSSQNFHWRWKHTFFLFKILWKQRKPWEILEKWILITFFNNYQRFAIVLRLLEPLTVLSLPFSCHLFVGEIRIFFL